MKIRIRKVTLAVLFFSLSFTVAYSTEDYRDDQDNSSHKVVKFITIHIDLVNILTENIEKTMSPTFSLFDFLEKTRLIKGIAGKDLTLLELTETVYFSCNDFFKHYPNVNQLNFSASVLRGILYKERDDSVVVENAVNRLTRLCEGKDSNATSKTSASFLYGHERRY